jgi:hypothetical protein
MGRQLLILLLGGASRAELEAAVEERGDGYPSVYVVVPAHVGALDWLATDERRAQDVADVQALEAEWLLAGIAEIDGGEAGNPDPVQAVADALERFTAEEIVVVAPGEVDQELLSELRTLGPPVTAPGLLERPSTGRSRLRASLRAMQSGRSESTPWLAFVGANLGLLLFCAAFAIVGAIIVWLATSLS